MAATPDACSIPHDAISRPLRHRSCARTRPWPAGGSAIGSSHVTATSAGSTEARERGSVTAATLWLSIVTTRARYTLCLQCAPTWGASFDGTVPTGHGTVLVTGRGSIPKG